MGYIAFTIGGATPPRQRREMSPEESPALAKNELMVSGANVALSPFAKFRGNIVVEFLHDYLPDERAAF